MINAIENAISIAYQDENFERNELIGGRGCYFATGYDNRSTIFDDESDVVSSILTRNASLTPS